MNSWTLTPLHGVIFVLQLIALVVKLFALIDCIAVPEGAFVATGKQTKPIWLAILGVAVLASFIGFLSILGLIAALVYILDVRPAVRGRSSSY